MVEAAAMVGLSPLDQLRAAVDKLGGQAAMARLVGVKQPTVWRWLNVQMRMPPEHVLKVEEATGISRHALRPDIYPAQPEPASEQATDRYNGVRA